jgi:hypothetical protein
MAVGRVTIMDADDTLREPLLTAAETLRALLQPEMAGIAA